jgi:hypothetical protein
MESMAAISDSAAAGVLGANDANQPPAPLRTDEMIGDDIPTPVVACRSWYVSHIVRLQYNFLLTFCYPEYCVIRDNVL